MRTEPPPPGADVAGELANPAYWLVFGLEWPGGGGAGGVCSRPRCAAPSFPFTVACQNLAILWHATAGHRDPRRWYRTRAELSAADMIVKPRNREIKDHTTNSCLFLPFMLILACRRNRGGLTLQGLRWS